MGSLISLTLSLKERLWSYLEVKPGTSPHLTIMTNNKKSNKNNANKRSRMAIVQPRVSRNTSASASAGEAYKRILVDPCYAQLPPSPYATSSGGVIARTHAQVASSQPFQIVFWHPSLGSFSYAEATGAVAGGLTSYSTFWTGVTTGTTRSIAGCISATYTGAENSRAGIIRCGLVSGELVWQFMTGASGGNANTFALNTLGAYLAHMERTPVDKCEVNWVPGEGDSDFGMIPAYSAAYNNAIQSTFAKTNFCVILVQGSGGTSVIDFASTSVYEFQSNTNTLIAGGNPVWDVSQNSRPSFDFRSVVSDLAKRDSSWFLNTFRKMGSLVGGAARGYVSAGLPGALGYLTSAAMGRVR